MRILITGGFGFLGGRLAQHLQFAGHHVVLLLLFAHLFWQPWLSSCLHANQPTRKKQMDGGGETKLPSNCVFAIFV